MSFPKKNVDNVQIRRGRECISWYMSGCVVTIAGFCSRPTAIAIFDTIGIIHLRYAMVIEQSFHDVQTTIMNGMYQRRIAIITIIEKTSW